MTDSLFTPDHLALILHWLKSGSINIFGLPFAGKDTHGEALAKFFDAPLIGGGDILRSIAIPTDLKKKLDAGVLFPTEQYLRIVTPYLANPAFDDRPLILSSVGRWIGEEKGVIQATASSGHPMKAVIYLHVAEEVVRKRWARSQEKGDRGNRADDAESLLDIRIREFQQKTLPVIEVYRQKGLLIEINSDAEKDEVLENILARLLMIATSHA